MRGRISKFFPQRHYGFIVCPNGEFFFHESEVQGEFQEGAQLEFEEGSFRGRACAVKIRPIQPVGATSMTEVSNGSN